MLTILIMALYFSIPVLLLAFLGISIYRYGTAKKQEAKAPGSVQPRELKNRKNILIVAATLVGIMLAVTIGFVILLALSIAYM